MKEKLHNFYDPQPSVRESTFGSGKRTQLLPVEILAHTLVHCQKTTAVAQTCRYLRAFVSTNTFVAAWIIMWHGRRNALSQRAMWGQVISPNLILSLLYQGSDVHADSDWALRAAAANGWYPLTRTLIEEYGSDVHALDGYALRWSSYSGHTDVVEYLLQRGALVGVYNCLRGPADQGNLEIIRKLVAAGALDPDGGAVQSAARHGHLEILQYLTKHIVRTRRSEDHLAEALRQAASNAHDEIVKYLVVECNAGFGTGLINAHTSATLHGHKSTVLLLTNLADEVNDRYLGDM